MATMTCPHCGATLPAGTVQAGREYRCGGCGETFRIDRADEPEPPPVVVGAVSTSAAVLVSAPQVVVVNRGPAVGQHAAGSEQHRPVPPAEHRDEGWRPTIRRLMVGATLLWVIAMVGLFALFCAVWFGDSDIRDVGALRIDESTGQTWAEGDWIASGILSAATLSVCFPTVPYAVCMVFLVVALFATKRD